MSAYTNAPLPLLANVTVAGGMDYLMGKLAQLEDAQDALTMDTPAIGSYCPPATPAPVSRASFAEDYFTNAHLLEDLTVAGGLDYLMDQLYLLEDASSEEAAALLEDILMERMALPASSVPAPPEPLRPRDAARGRWLRLRRAPDVRVRHASWPRCPGPAHVPATGPVSRQPARQAAFRLGTAADA